MTADAISDVTGDGHADLVGFGQSVAGTYVATSHGDGTFGEFTLAVNDFDEGSGWTDTRHVRQVADITGDGRADIVGFGNAGVYTIVSAGDGTFTGGGPTVAVVPNLTGDTQSQAAAALQAAGLVVGQVTFSVDNSCNNIGSVMSQNPSPGTQVAPGSAVNLTIGQQPTKPCP